MNFKINKTKIGLKHKPFIIAEMSGNHNQSLERALNIVEAAAKSGADAIKLQTYRPDTITMDINRSEFMINDHNSLWAGKSLYQLYEEAHTPWEWHENIIKHAKKFNIICFSSPFDETAVDFLEDLNVPAYKIASCENIHIPLIKKVSKTGKPIIISTGMASLSDLDELIQAIGEDSCEKIALLKCTSTYPATPDNSNILTIPHMRKLFNCEIGLSDHTMGNGAAIAAVSHGATIIEKHFTLSRDDGGVDSAFSLEPEEMKSLVFETKQAWMSLGKIYYGATESEKSSMKFRRSVYISKDLKKGQKITKKNIKIIRPGLGVKPKYFELLLGRKINQNVKKGTPLSWDLVGGK